MSKIPLPRLLDRDTLKFVQTIHPVKTSVELNIVPLSTASIQLPENESLPPRSFVEMFTVLGSAGIYRVRAPQNTYGSGENASISELEHAVAEVGDWIIKDKISENMAANRAMQAVFAHYGGSKWRLGDTSALGTGQIAVSFDHDIVLQAMISLLGQTPECMMDFDFSTSPWTINFKKRDTKVSAEGRLGRNISTAVITYDDSALCTRAYYECESTTGGSVDGIPVFDASKNYSAGDYVNYNSRLYLLSNGHLSGKTWAETVKDEVKSIPSSTWAYVDADTISKWGVVERIVNTGADFTPDEARRVASDYVRKHRNPKLSIEISGATLSYITKEPLDTFRLAKLFRLALQKYGITVEENITGMVWDDVYGNPLGITVYLAEEEDTALTFMHEMEATGTSTSVGGGGGGGKKQNDVWKEFRTGIDRTDMMLDLWARRYNKAEEILQQAGLYIDANGTLNYAQDIEHGLYAQIQTKANEITASVEDKEKQLKSEIKVERDKISQVVSAVGEDGKVTAASIVTAVNKAGSSVVINADHIQLTGNVKLNDVMNVTGGAVHISKPLLVDGLYADFNEIRIHGSRFAVNGSVGDYMVKSASKDGDVLTLTLFNGTKINFSKATTLTGQWSSGIYTVIAKQNSENVETDTTTLFSGEVSDYTQWAGNTAFISLKAFTKGSSGLQDTGRVISLNCQDIYDAGKRDGSGNYRLFGYFDKYGTITVEGQTYTAYITQSTSASASHLALYRA